jgi:hypothetical protein
MGKKKLGPAEKGMICFGLFLFYAYNFLGNYFKELKKLPIFKLVGKYFKNYTY